MKGRAETVFSFRNTKILHNDKMIHKSEITGFETIRHEADLCVVGAGAAGMFAAVAAARHGAKVELNERPPGLSAETLPER